MRVLFVAWRDLAHPQAGGSEVVVDRLARGLLDQGHDAALLCGGPVGLRPYEVIEAGGTFSQYVRAPIEYARRADEWDIAVDVENGIPFFASLWRRDGASVCLVHHVHGRQWNLRFPQPVAAAGRLIEAKGMPSAYRDRLFAAISPSTAEGLEGIGVDPARIRVIPVGVDMYEPPAARSDSPLFLAFGRLVPHKRFDLLLEMWEEVRPQTGGRLVIAGDGPERAKLAALAGGEVELRGDVSDDEKRKLFSEAWLLLHPAAQEGWGLVIVEAGVARTPAVGFDVPGVRDAIRPGESGVLASDRRGFEGEWIRLAADGSARRRLGEGARRRAAELSWDRSVETLLDIAVEAVALHEEAPR